MARTKRMIMSEQSRTLSAVAVGLVCATPRLVTPTKPESRSHVPNHFPALRTGGSFGSLLPPLGSRQDDAESYKSSAVGLT